MNYIKITKHDIANGEGIRVVLWVSGCSLHCDECHNPQTWDFNAGQVFDEESKKELFEALAKPYVEGLTLSGGHPLEKENRHEIFNLLEEVKINFPDKNIWLYTGYIWDNIFYYNSSALECLKNIVSLCDVVVDGKYMKEKRNISLAWRGSENQRVIDVQKSLKENKVVLWKSKNLKDVKI